MATREIGEYSLPDALAFCLLFGRDSTNRDVSPN
jgi:hypothetical protein